MLSYNSKNMQCRFILVCKTSSVDDFYYSRSNFIPFCFQYLCFVFMVNISFNGTIINTAHSHLHRDLYELKFKEVKRAKNTPNVGLEPTTPRLRVSCSTD